jgi:hypothetical protein
MQCLPVKTVLIIQLQVGLSRGGLDKALCTQCQSTEKSAIIQGSAAVFLRPSQGMMVVVYRRFGTIIKGQAKHATCRVPTPVSDYAMAPCFTGWTPVGSV